jgi:hypothetical protein
MPYASKAQQGYFNSNRRKLGSAVVDKFNSDSKGQKNLPERAADDPKRQAKVRRLNAMTTVYPEKSASVDSGTSDDSATRDTSGDSTWLSTLGPWMENMTPGAQGAMYTGGAEYSQTKPGLTIPSNNVTRSTGEAGQPADPFQTTTGLNRRAMDKMHIDLQKALAQQKMKRRK